MPVPVIEGTLRPMVRGMQAGSPSTIILRAMSVGAFPMSKAIAIAAMCGLAALIGVCKTALAQAGSTGGTIGKTDKSVSGGEEGPAPGVKNRKSTAVEVPSKASISGRWSWRGKCADDTEWSGDFDLVQSADGSVRGTCSTTQESCSTVSGQVVGNKATLSVGWRVRTGTLSVTVAESRKSMSGWETSPYRGRCTYEMRRF
jgi:hypothetical protein